MASTDETPAYVDHSMLTPGVVERRLYQLELAGAAKEAHTLVCLPTGLGKTTVSLLVTAERLAELGGTALLLAPTKPLVEQHAAFYRRALTVPDEEIVVFTGSVRPDDRAARWDDATVVVATPQVIENDLIGGRIDLADVVHLTFDECHRATGEYAYVYIAERYHQDAERPLVTGMSASPGDDEAAILEVCENLGIVEVEVMTEEDPAVATYTHETDVEWRRVQVPEELIEIREALESVLRDRLEQLVELGVLDSARVDVSRKELLRLRGELQALIADDDADGYRGMSLHAEAMKLKHAVEIVDSQGVEALLSYMERLRNEARSSGASKASQRLVTEPSFRYAELQAEEYDDLHPKLSEVRRLVIETLAGGGERVIVFTEYRDTAETLTAFLDEHVDVERFVGQGDKQGSDGMTQREQREVLEAFRSGEVEVLVSTSVAEEGLDVPEVDLVCFYEPVPTAIRSIQRKGRTGRQSSGRVVVLVAEDTRDEAYFWISRRREKEMASELRKLKGIAEDVESQLDDGQRALDAFEGAPSGEPGDGEGGNADGTGRGATADGGGSGQRGLADFAPGPEDLEGNGDEDADADGSDEANRGSGAGQDGDETGDRVVAGAGGDGREDGPVEVVVDQRELDASIAKSLSGREDVEVRLETLEVGDYVLSDRVVVERKTVADFLDTLLGGDRSLFEQVGDMRRHYARPVVIIEGDGLYEERNVHPNAIRGALASLAVDFGASVLQTDGERATAELLAVIAGREQRRGSREVRVHGRKASKTLAEQQEYVVASIADIGPVTARALLEALGSVEAVMTADRETLTAVEGVGDVTADRIREVVASAYRG